MATTPTIAVAPVTPSSVPIRSARPVGSDSARGSDRDVDRVSLVHLAIHGCRRRSGADLQRHDQSDADHECCGRRRGPRRVPPEIGGRQSGRDAAGAGQLGGQPQRRPGPQWGEHKDADGGQDPAGERGGQADREQAVDQPGHAGRHQDPADDHPTATGSPVLVGGRHRLQGDQRRHPHRPPGRPPGGEDGDHQTEQQHEGLPGEIESGAVGVQAGDPGRGHSHRHAQQHPQRGADQRRAAPPRG